MLLDSESVQTCHANFQPGLRLSTDWILHIVDSQKGYLIIILQNFYKEQFYQTLTQQTSFRPDQTQTWRTRQVFQQSCNPDHYI